MAWIGREYSRDVLARAQAHRHARADKEDFDAWSRDVEMTTGVPRDV